MELMTDAISPIPDRVLLGGGRRDWKQQEKYATRSKQFAKRKQIYAGLNLPERVAWLQAQPHISNRFLVIVVCNTMDKSK